MLRVMRASSEERLEMGRKGRGIVRDRFDLVRVMSRWQHALIEELMPSRTRQ
jgi:hypothetical protein